MKKLSMLLVVILSLALYSCIGGSGFKHGQTVTVTKKCIWASNENTYDQMTKYCNRRDERGLELMESRGEVGILWSGDKGTVTDLAFGKVKIRLDNDKEVWVASEFLK